LFSLGAYHDVYEKGCDEREQYVMAAKGDGFSKKVAGNDWMFSKCSVKSFDAFFTSLNRLQYYWKSISFNTF